MIKEIAFRELLDSSIVVDYDELTDAYTMIVEGSGGGGGGGGGGTPNSSLLSAISMISADGFGMTIMPNDERFCGYSALSESFPELFFDRPIGLSQTITSVIVNPSVYPPVSGHTNITVRIFKNGNLIKIQNFGDREMYLSAPFILDLTTGLEVGETNSFEGTDTFLISLTNNLGAVAFLNVQSIYINGYFS